MCLSSPEDQNPIPCSYAEKPLPHYFVQFYSCLHWEGEPKTCYAIMVGGRPYLFEKKKMTVRVLPIFLKYHVCKG